MLYSYSDIKRQTNKQTKNKKRQSKETKKKTKTTHKSKKHKIKKKLAINSNKMSLGITFTESYHEIVLLHSLNQQDSLISKNMHATGNLLFSNRGCLFLRQPLRS